MELEVGDQGLGIRWLRARLAAAWEWIEGWRTIKRRYADACLEIKVQKQCVRRVMEEARLERSALQALRTEAAADGVLGDEFGLTPAGIERLALLVERCGGATRAAGWVLFGGWDAQAPHGSLTNRVALERALGELRAVIWVMCDAGKVRLKEMAAWQAKYRG